MFRVLCILLCLTIVGTVYGQTLSTCDELASHPFDDTNPVGIVGVSGGDLDLEAALAACGKYLRENPTSFRAQYLYARILSFAERDEEALVLLKLVASTTEHRMANYTIGLILSSGYSDRAADRVKAHPYFLKSADLGLVYGMEKVSENYWYGRGVEENNEEAIKWFRKAIELGSVKSEHKLGVSYLYGYGVEENIEEGIKWIRKGVDQGFASSQVALAQQYLEGLGVEKDFDQAIDLFTLAAEQNYSNAIQWLAHVYFSSDYNNQDYEKSIIWFLKGAEQEFVWAYINLAYIYRNGAGVKKDYKEFL